MDRQKSIRRGSSLLPSCRKAIGFETRMGFSLIEAAIVLGVVGLVIGGIWVSAAHFYEEYKVNKTVDGAFTTASNIINLISVRDASSIADGSDLTSFLLSAGAFPEDWVNGSVVKNPFGGRVAVLDIDDRPFLFLEATPDIIPASACIKIVAKAATTGIWANNSGDAYLFQPTRMLRDITMYDGWLNTGTNVYFTSVFPVDMNAVEAGCKNSNRHTITFSFFYTRIN